MDTQLFWVWIVLGYMEYKDQLQRILNLPNPPQRIISLVPSHTELLYDLGLEERIIGVTRFCIFPERAKKDKTIIGGTKNLKLERIRDLNPDFIFADKEENTKEQIEELAKEFPIWISNIKNYEDALEMIKCIGQVTNKEVLSDKIIANINLSFKKLDTSRSDLRVAYFIWQDPLMVSGNDTFIQEMITKIGLKNAFQEQSRYPSITPKALQKAKPDLIFLSSEPYPFQEKHIAYFQELMPDSKVVLVDGTYFSWFGSRMAKAGSYFQLVLKNTL